MSDAPLARRAPEAAIFAAAIAVALLHALDDAFGHREPGVGMGQHVLAAVVSLALGLGAVYAFPHLRPAARSALAFFFGALAIVNGALHLEHINGEGMAGADLTGVLALAAGVVLVALAAYIPWRHRGAGTAGPRRRWAYRVAAVPAGLLLALFTVVPIGTAITETHKFREPIGAPPSADYRAVAFDATDGVHLSAGIARRATARPSSSSTGAAATAPARSRTPSSSSATATASCSTTPAAAARAKASRTRSAGAGRRTSPARSPS